MHFCLCEKHAWLVFNVQEANTCLCVWTGPLDISALFAHVLPVQKFCHKGIFC